MRLLSKQVRGNAQYPNAKFVRCHRQITRMPQPLSKVCRNPKIDSWGVGSIGKRPVLASLYAQAISSWGDVEAYQLMLFVTLLGGNEAIAAKIYLSLDTARAKSKVLEQLVGTIKDERRKNVTRAVISIGKAREKERDKLAHRALGICNELRDAFLLVNPKEIVSKAEIHYGDILVYRQKDFLALVEGNMRLCDYLNDLREILKKTPSKKANRLLEALYETPEIQERLSRPASVAQSAPAGSS